MQIIEITKRDFELFWPVFKEVVSAQETYAFDPEIDFESAYNLWCLSAQKTYVIKENGLILGSYYIKPNASGPSAHISSVHPETQISALPKTYSSLAGIINLLINKPYR